MPSRGPKTEEDTFFRLVECRLPIFLQPSRFGDLGKAVQEQLNSLLFTYAPKLGGVIVAYSKVKVQEPTGKIFNNFSHVKIAVSTRFLLYAPSVGSYITGRVNKVGPDFVGLITEGVFNVSVARAGLSGWVYTAGTWVKRDPQEPGKKQIVIKPGMEMDVVVLGMKEENSHIFILANLPSHKLDRHIRHVKPELGASEYPSLSVSVTPSPSPGPGPSPSPSPLPGQAKSETKEGKATQVGEQRGLKTKYKSITETTKGSSVSKTRKNPPGSADGNKTKKRKQKK
ncbi:hypothetical protein AAMO2058_000341400 [Amorphochlora amoebiformis]